MLPATIAGSILTSYQIVMTIIKRYSNRKLYNTASRHYVTLDEIRSLVKEGIEIQVIDNVSGEDITEKILIQIILANGKESGDLMPRSFLAEMIKTGARPIISFQTALINYLQHYNVLDFPSRQDVLDLIEQIELLEEKINRSASKPDTSN